MPGIRKLYYSISEVSELTGLKPHVLRYWETEFDLLDPKKNRAGNRAYTERDLGVVKRIQYLLRDRKFTIEGARQELDRWDESAPHEEATRQDLQELRGFLQNLLDRLEETA